MKTQVPIVLGSFVLAALLQTASAQNIIFDNFEVDEGHFNLSPGFSGSSVGETNTTADRVTTDGPFEGIGHQKLVLDHDATTTAIRIRHLSGGGTPANNVAFSTSGAEDGWIGFYLKTLNTGWTAQLWMEGVSINGGIPKNVMADDAWHLYEWNLDDNSGGPDGWGTISGIITGVATVSDGSHTIDSIVLRDGTTPSSSSTIFLDFVAKSASGSIAGVVPEPSAVALSVLGGVALCLVLIRRRK